MTRKMKGLTGAITKDTRRQMHSAEQEKKLDRLTRWLDERRSVHVDLGGKQVSNLIAAVISKTYAECGDAATLPDDMALMAIRDILLKLDEEIIKRNRDNRFVKRFIGKALRN